MTLRFRSAVRISVIIPVYNVEQYLARCLDSVLAAVAYADVETEILCVDDGSTDGSRAILEDYRSREPSMTVIGKPNGGLGSARNAGLDAATGDYVLFVDSDDWIPPHSIAVFASVAAASGAALVVSTAFVKSKSAILPRIPPPRKLPPAWRMRPSAWIAGRKVQYSAWNKLYRAELFRVRRYPATVFEDFPVTTDILCEVGEFAAVDEPLYVYCANPGASSLVRSPYTRRKLDDSLTVVRQTLETARRQWRPALAEFALGRAASGHASTIGHVWKSKDPELAARLLAEHARLQSDYPEMAGRLAWKARLRLWRMGRA